MRFLTETDFESNINKVILYQLIDNDLSKLETVEKRAIDHVISKLSDRYDILSELDNTGEERSENLIRYLLAIAVYTLYNAIPDSDIPERVRNNYTDTLKEMSNIAAGKESTNLKRVISQGQAKTKFRWGSSPKRTHNPFE